MTTIDVIYRYVEDGRIAKAPPASPEVARRRLEQGNREFAALFDGLTGVSGSRSHVVPVDPRDLSIGQSGNKAPTQRPFAAVLGCSDARVPIEFIFNEGPNDLFVVRVAGNGIGPDTLGSLRYAIEHLGHSLKLVVVLGHSGCGAISAAVDIFLNPANYLALATNRELRGILDHLLIVVHVSARTLSSMFGPEIQSHSRYREALIETSSVINTALAAYTVQQAIADQPLEDIQAVYGVYVLESRRLWVPKTACCESAGLAVAPADLDEFLELGAALAGSERILSILGMTQVPRHRQ